MERITNALFLSDLHFGWQPMHGRHAELLAHLDQAADDAEVIVFNGDIIDGFRGQPTRESRELVRELAGWMTRMRREGRHVVYLEGNHDRLASRSKPPIPDDWTLDLNGYHGERIRVLHGHRFHSDENRSGAYERHGHKIVRRENHLYAKAPVLLRPYPFSFGLIAASVGLVEHHLWRPRFVERASRLSEVDVLVHGHFHYGPGSQSLAHIALYKSGAWVSRAHLGSVDRLLRYRRGVFERIALIDGKWVAQDDGR